MLPFQSPLEPMLAEALSHRIHLFSQLAPPNPFSLAKIVALSPGHVAAT